MAICATGSSTRDYKKVTHVQNRSAWRLPRRAHLPAGRLAHRRCSPGSRAPQFTDPEARAMLTHTARRPRPAEQAGLLQAGPLLARPPDPRSRLVSRAIRGPKRRSRGRRALTPTEGVPTRSAGCLAGPAAALSALTNRDLERPAMGARERTPSSSPADTHRVDTPRGSLSRHPANRLSRRHRKLRRGPQFRGGAYTHALGNLCGRKSRPH